MGLWSVKERTLTLHFHPGQMRAWRSRARFVFIIAGYQAGKTSFGPWWLWREIRRRGPGDYLAVTPTYDLFKVKMLPEMRIVFEELLGVARYWPGERVLELRDPATRLFRARRASDLMWGRIILRSAVRPSSLEAATVNAAWLDECGQDAFGLDAWVAVQGRLALNQGRVLGTTTIYNAGWLKTEVYDRWREGDPAIDVIQFPSTLNPSFPLSEFERAQQTIQDWRFRMRYLAEFTQPGNLIYPDMTDERWVAPFPIPAHWPRAVGVDFGGVHNAVVFLAGDPTTSTWYIYDEVMLGNQTIAEYVRAVLNRLGGVDYIAAGGSKGEEQIRRDWTAAGLPLRAPLVDDVEAGIDRVTAFIRSGRLRGFRSCSGIRDEFGSYRREVDDQGNDRIWNQRAFHRLDALRYIVQHLAHRRVYLA